MGSHGNSHGTPREPRVVLHPPLHHVPNLSPSSFRREKASQRDFPRDLTGHPMGPPRGVASPSSHNTPHRKVSGMSHGTPWDPTGYPTTGGHVRCCFTGERRQVDGMSHGTPWDPTGYPTTGRHVCCCVPFRTTLPASLPQAPGREKGKPMGVPMISQVSSPMMGNPRDPTGKSMYRVGICVCPTGYRMGITYGNHVCYCMLECG